MLTYATIFIASIIVAVVALVLYRIISDSSKSILSSKGPVSIVSSTPNLSKGRTPATVTGTMSGSARKSRAAPVNVTRKTPAMPSESVDWGWREGGSQVSEQYPHHSSGAADGKHCSLYDVDPTAFAKRDVTWPHREEKRETGGKAYKVTRKTASRRPSTDDESGKPWGW